MTSEDISSFVTNSSSFYFVPEECPGTSIYGFLYSYLLMAVKRPFALMLLTHR